MEPEHDLGLKAPDCPVVNVGTRERPCYLPPEFCQVLPGQIVKRLHEKQSKDMMLSACEPPANNATDIVQKGLEVVGIAGGHSDSLVSQSSISLVMWDFLIPALRPLSASELFQG